VRGSADVHAAADVTPDTSRVAVRIRSSTSSATDSALKDRFVPRSSRSPFLGLVFHDMAGTPVASGKGDSAA
jgi:hypothetical protein